MTSRSVSISAPFNWLMQTFESARRHPRPLVGGLGFLSLVAMVPTAVQMAVELALPGNFVALGVVMALATVFNLIVLPPLTGGMYRMLHAAENDGPVQAGDVFAGFRQDPQRMIGVALTMTLTSIAVLGLIFLMLPGKEFWYEIFRIAFTTPPGAEPDMSTLPQIAPGAALGTLACMALLVVTTFVLANANMFAYTRAALSGRGVAAAIGDGFSAVMRNVLPLLVFAGAMFFVGMVAMMIIGLLLGIVMAVASMISPALGMIVMLPLYLLLFVGMYLLVLGFYYHGWRELFGDEAAVAPAPADTIAL